MHKTNDITPAALVALLRKTNKVILANVRNGTHFVLVTGYPKGVTPSQFAVNDPALFQTAYSFDSIVGFRVLTVASI